MTAVCNRDCFHCIYEDCICDAITIEDFQAEKEIDLISGAKVNNTSTKIREYKKQYQENNKERIKEYQDRYYVDHREMRCAYQKEYRARNPDRIAAYQKQYREKNHEKLALAQRLRRKKEKLNSQTTADSE